MTRFSIVSSVTNMFGLLVLKDGQVWNFTAGRAEALPADNTPTLDHLLPITPYKASGPLAAYKRCFLSLNTDILVGSDFIVFSGAADGTNLTALDAYPYQYLDSPWIGRGGWGRG